VFVELHLYAPLEGRSEDTRLALHETARQLKSEHGLRQVSVLEEDAGDLCLMSIWESRDAWTRAHTARERIASEVDLTGVDPGRTRVLLLAET
jgi:heme-degrading monooxygenase HmoA